MYRGVRVKTSADPTNPYEDEEAIVFHNWLEYNHIPHNHRPNETGGKGAMARRNMKMKAMGMSAGAWDYEIFVPLGEGKYKQLEVELKRRKRGVVSENQKKWEKIYEGAGIPHEVCKGADEAIEYVKQFMPKRLKK
ncbi:MAG: hypothetical protein UE295_06065 [Acutalibacteraceae bacterium]|nr:hypothetical protein [Acutalibacteraceae bacterium]